MVFDVLSSRDSDIRNQLLLDTHAISQASMMDFDWKLKVFVCKDFLSGIACI